MPYEAYGATKHKETIQATIGDQFSRLFYGERATATQHIHKADSNAPIYIENEIGLLLSCDLLYSQRKLENCIVLEVLAGIVFDNLTPTIAKDDWTD